MLCEWRLIKKLPDSLRINRLVLRGASANTQKVQASDYHIQSDHIKNIHIFTHVDTYEPNDIASMYFCVALSKEFLCWAYSSPVNANPMCACVLIMSGITAPGAVTHGDQKGSSIKKLQDRSDEKKRKKRNRGMEK